MTSPQNAVVISVAASMVAEPVESKFSWRDPTECSAAGKIVVCFNLVCSRIETVCNSVHSAIGAEQCEQMKCSLPSNTADNGFLSVP
jgi:hypothetical protein